MPSAVAGGAGRLRCCGTPGRRGSGHWRGWIGAADRSISAAVLAEVIRLPARLHRACTPGTRRGHTQALHLNDRDKRLHEVLIMHEHAQPGQTAPAESFPTDPSGLPEARRPAVLELADRDAFD